MELLTLNTLVGILRHAIEGALRAIMEAAGVESVEQVLELLKNQEAEVKEVKEVEA